MNNFDDLKIDVENIPPGAIVDVLANGGETKHFLIYSAPFLSYDKERKMVILQISGNPREVTNWGLRAQDTRWQRKISSEILVMY